MSVVCSKRPETRMLLQARAALSYEGVLCDARHELVAHGEAAAAAAKAAQDREAAAAAEKADLQGDVRLKEAQLKSVAQVCCRWKTHRHHWLTPSRCGVLVAPIQYCSGLSATELLLRVSISPQL